MYSIIGGIAFLNIPKCGSSTLRSLEVHRAQASERFRYKKRVAFMRHPNERFQSGYRFFNKTKLFVPKECIGNYENYVDWALESDDEHVAPQSHFLKLYGDDTVTEILDISCMTEYLESIVKHPVDVMNSTIQEPLNNSYRADDIAMRYAKDLELYNVIR